MNGVLILNTVLAVVTNKHFKMVSTFRSQLRQQLYMHTVYISHSGFVLQVNIFTNFAFPWLFVKLDPESAPKLLVDMVASNPGLHHIAL